LFGGMVLAENGTEEEFGRWCAKMAASGSATAACANLVLQPNAHPCDLAHWLAILIDDRSARYAYETVRWARHTWLAPAWENLKNALMEKVMSDSGQWRFHWLRDIQPSAAAANIGDDQFSPLWAAELVDALELNDYALRFRLGEHLGSSADDDLSWTLRWLNLRWERSQRGTPV
jgi:hypothetical protein